MNNTVTIGGVDYAIAPLKALQVAAFLDASPAGATSETKTQIYTRSLLTIAWALRNADSPLIDGLGDEESIVRLNDTMTFPELDAAFGVVLDLSGLKFLTTPVPVTEVPASEPTVATAAA